MKEFAFKVYFPPIYLVCAPMQLQLRGEKNRFSLVAGKDK